MLHLMLTTFVNTVSPMVYSTPQTPDIPHDMPPEVKGSDMPHCAHLAAQSIHFYGEHGCATVADVSYPTTFWSTRGKTYSDATLPRMWSLCFQEQHQGPSFADEPRRTMRECYSCIPRGSSCGVRPSLRRQHWVPILP